MNVRHGEVKLVQNIQNIDANLSYGSLMASTIEGPNALITASYSPVNVAHWGRGQLNTNYSESVRLNEVKYLKLNGTSSDVVIERVLSKAQINADLGSVTIQSVADGFNELNIAVKNGAVLCVLPKSSFTLNFDGDFSSFQYPSNLVVQNKEENQKQWVSGYQGQKENDRLIKIQSKFGEVSLEN
jgi:hypothetical protein